MDEILKFFIKIGKLKSMPRRGWVIRGVKNPESIADHIFRVTIMVWLLADRKKSKLNLEKLIKMALIHDICEVYSGDITPYDSILPKSKKARMEMFKTWPRFSEAEKKRLSDEKYKKEKAGLEMLIKDLSPHLKNEIKHLWLDYEKGLTPEGRFFKQTDRLESFLQALEYWKIDKKLPQGSWWMQAGELFDEQVLIDFMHIMDKEFHKKLKLKA